MHPVSRDVPLSRRQAVTVILARQAVRLALEEAGEGAIADVGHALGGGPGDAGGGAQDLAEGGAIGALGGVELVKAGADRVLLRQEISVL